MSGCAQKSLKELLPAYREGGLAGQDLRRVEEHLAKCTDCRAELSLVTLLAEEPVPDPGEAFWLAFPGRVARAVQEQTSPAAGSRARRWFAPRFALGAASLAVAVLAFVAVLLLRPAPLRIARVPSAQNTPALEDVLQTEPVSLSDMSASELAAAAAWANSAFAPIREAIRENLPDEGEQDLSDDLSDMNSAELQRVSIMLDRQAPSRRDRLHSDRSPVAPEPCFV